MVIVGFTFTLMTRLIKRSAHPGWAVRLYLLPLVRLKKVRWLKAVTRIRYGPDKREPRFPTNARGNRETGKRIVRKLLMEAVVDGDDSTKVGSVGVVRWLGGGAPHCNWGSDNSRRASDPGQIARSHYISDTCNDIASRHIVHTRCLFVCLFVWHLRCEFVRCTLYGS